MDLSKRFYRLGDEVRELLKKLSVSQRVTIGLLSVLLTVAAAAALALSRGDAYVRLGSGADAKALASMRDLLDRHGIPYRLATEGGRAGLEVPPDRASHARWLAAEGGLTGAKDSNLDWLFGEAGFTETGARFDQQLLESRKRIVEDAIRWSPGIRDARIVVQRGPEPIYAGRNGASDSAAVAVALRAGTDSLTRGEARAIRSLVAGAFNIPPQNIQLTDDHLRYYLDSGGGPAGASDDDDRTRERVIATVEKLLSRIYRPMEFVVGVLVDLSGRRSQVVTETYDPEKTASAQKSSIHETETAPRALGGPVWVEPAIALGGLGSAAPASAPSAPAATEPRGRDRQESTFENRFTTEKKQEEIPAGELKGISLNVVLDRAAVRRVLQAEEFTRLTADRRAAEKVERESDIVNFTVEGRLGRENLDQAIEAHRRAQAEFLKDQLPMPGAKVNVSVVMFPRPEMPLEQAASGVAAAWATRHLGELLLGSTLLAGLFLVYRLFQRTASAPLDVPPLEEAAVGVEAGAGPEKEALEVVRTARSASGLAREKPELAASVIRLWMAQDREED